MRTRALRSQHQLTRLFPAMVAVAITFALALVAAPAAAAAGTGPTTAVTVNGASAQDGLTLQVTGSGYVDLPTPTATPTAQGVYVALRDPATMDNDAINADNSIVPAVGFVPKARISDGDWQTTLTAAADTLDPDAKYQVIVWTAHGNITGDTLLATEDVTLTGKQRDALFAAASTSTQPSTAKSTTKSTTKSTASAPASSGAAPTKDASSTAAPHSTDRSIAASHSNAATPTVHCTDKTVPASAGTPELNWGVKSAFTTYLEGNVAKGSVTVSNGAARHGEAFSWGAGSGSLDTSGHGTLSFAGAVTFTGHGGALNTTLSHVRVIVGSGDHGTLVLDAKSQDMQGNDVSGNDVTFAKLSFSSLSQDGGVASATLTAAGAKILAGFYPAGESLDNVTLSFDGAHPATSEQVCVDARGNRVNADGSPYRGLASTGTNTGGEMTLAGVAIAAGMALLLLGRTRRRAAHR